MSGQREAGSGLFQLGGIPGRRGEDASGLSRWPPSPSGGKPLTGPSTQPPRAAEQMRFRACRRRAVKGGRCCSADARLREGRTRLCPQTQAAPEKTGQRGSEGGLAPTSAPGKRSMGARGGAGSATGPQTPPSRAKMVRSKPDLATGRLARSALEVGKREEGERCPLARFRLAAWLHVVTGLLGADGMRSSSDW